MEIVQGWEDIISITQNFLAVIWGAGKLGRMLLQEVRVNKLQNVYIFDENAFKTKDMNERIFFNQIKQQMENISFIIAVSNSDTISEISKKILLYNNNATIYRYIPKDYVYLEKKLREVGFYNGIETHKALNPLDAKHLIERKLSDAQPFLCARWGGVEGNAVYADNAEILNDLEVASLKNNAGFYPLDTESVHEFARCAINAAKEIDILIAGSWCQRIEDLYRLYSPNAVLVTSDMMTPFWDEVSWTRALKGKKVLVIHPFAKLIEKQYVYHSKIFVSPDILPEMDLITYQAVQSMNGNSEFKSWFEALDKMEKDISCIDFDIALIGCGAYGMPLGAFIKSDLHKRAVHMGGALQILFGIKGKRWEHMSYDYQHKLYNDYWVRPTDDLKPRNYKEVEGGCYW